MLTGKQKRYLRSLANQLSPIFQVGKTGIHENLINQLKDALEKRELIKISVLKNCELDKHDVAEQLSAGTDSEVVQVIGNNIILYKQSVKHQQIELP